MENRDAEATYNPYQATELDEKFPGFPFSPVAAGSGCRPGDPGSGCTQPSFLRVRRSCLRPIPLMSWKLWAVWTVLCSPRAPFMYDELVQESLNFTARPFPVLSRFVSVGSARCVEKALGEEIGQEYAVHFPPSHKEKMLVLVGQPP